MTQEYYALTIQGNLKQFSTVFFSLEYENLIRVGRGTLRDLGHRLILSILVTIVLFGLYIVACQVHPAFVKQVQSRSIFLNFKWSVIRLKGPWSVSRCCPEPRWFIGDPTWLAHDNIYSYKGTWSSPYRISELWRTLFSPSHWDISNSAVWMAGMLQVISWYN